MSEEARTGKRFDLELPIKIHGKSGDDSATTGNMSAAGVYFMADLDLAIGSNIEFDITLPAKVLGTPGDVEVHCTGRVVRKDATAAAAAFTGAASDSLDPPIRTAMHVMITSAVPPSSASVERFTNGSTFGFS